MALQPLQVRASGAASLVRPLFRAPVHGQAGGKERTFSVHLGKNVCQCFQAECGVQGNVLDLWAAVQHLPLYEAAFHLAATFRLRRNREEEPVGGTR